MLTQHPSLDSDFLVFRGNEHESSGQLLKGVVAVCVPGPTRIEDIRLRLTGTRQLSYVPSRDPDCKVPRALSPS